MSYYQYRYNASMLYSRLQRLCNHWASITTKGISSINSPSAAYMRSELGQYWLRKWLNAWAVASHYLNHYLNIANWTIWNKLWCNCNRNQHIFIQENAFKMPSAKWQPFCPGNDELIIMIRVVSYICDKLVGVGVGLGFRKLEYT